MTVCEASAGAGSGVDAEGANAAAVSSGAGDLRNLPFPPPSLLLIDSNDLEQERQVTQPTQHWTPSGTQPALMACPHTGLVPLLLFAEWGSRLTIESKPKFCRIVCSRHFTGVGHLSQGQAYLYA
jgi:hypothetical protein|mmetsp:Transcript_22933/g.36489  ORF Transcript_22933/g.36489 Transcript_22933/m.36489 type:complete len:125 (-) Transcript_22933:1238-1612(-)